MSISVNISDWMDCDVSIGPDDFRFYVDSDATPSISILASYVSNVQDDSRFNVIPPDLLLWDSKADYHDWSTALDISAIPPPIFRPGPWSGDYQDLYEDEDDTGDVTWDHTIYDESINLEFPKGFLHPTAPVIPYTFDPYQPIIDLDIPPFDIPEIAIPYLVLPDFVINKKITRRGLRRVQINADDVCMSVTETFISHSKIQEITLSWDLPGSGRYVLMANNGNCYWQPVGPCD